MDDLTRAHSLKSLASAALIVSMTATALAIVSTPSAAQAAVVWNEDFNGAAGQGIATSKWNFDTGGGGFGNQELQYYNSGTSNTYQDGPGYSGGNAVGGTRNIGQPVGDAFHVFAIDWSPNLIVWTLDGAEYFRATPAGVRGNPWVFDHPFFIILNLAVGGTFPGSPTGSTPSVNRMLIDYVHVSTTSDPPSALRGTESGRCVDVPGANPADGTRLQVHDCNGTAAQQWTTRSGGTLRALGKCMDAAGAGTANGTPVQLYSCNGTNAQRFTLSAAGDLVNIGANKSGGDRYSSVR